MVCILACGRIPSLRGLMMADAGVDLQYEMSDDLHLVCQKRGFLVTLFVRELTRLTAELDARDGLHEEAFLICGEAHYSCLPSYSGSLLFIFRRLYEGCRSGRHLPAALLFPADYLPASSSASLCRSCKDVTVSASYNVLITFCSSEITKLAKDCRTAFFF